MPTALAHELTPRAPRPRAGIVPGRDGLHGDRLHGATAVRLPPAIFLVRASHPPARASWCAPPARPRFLVRASRPPARPRFLVCSSRPPGRASWCAPPDPHRVACPAPRTARTGTDPAPGHPLLVSATPPPRTRYGSASPARASWCTRRPTRTALPASRRPSLRCAARPPDSPSFRVRPAPPDSPSFRLRPAPPSPASRCAPPRPTRPALWCAPPRPASRFPHKCSAAPIASPH